MIRKATHNKILLAVDGSNRALEAVRYVSLMAPFKKMEASLLDAMQGEDRTDRRLFLTDPPIPPEDPFDYMALERLHAWTHLMLKDQDISALYITTSQKALEAVLASAPEAKKILPPPDPQGKTDDKGNVNKALGQTLEQIAMSGESSAYMEHAAVSIPTGTLPLVLYLMADVSPKRLFGRLLRNPPPPVHRQPVYRHTFVGLVEPSL